MGNDNILTQEEDDNVTQGKNVVTLQVNDSTNNNITNKNTQREDVLNYDTLTVTGDTIDTIATIDIATIATTTTGGNGTIDDTIPSATIKSPMISAVIAALTTVATSNSKIRNVSNDNVESSDDGNHYRISRMDKDGINDDNHDTSSSNDTQNDNDNDSSSNDNINNNISNNENKKQEKKKDSYTIKLSTPSPPQEMFRTTPQGDVEYSRHNYNNRYTLDNDDDNGRITRHDCQDDDGMDGTTGNRDDVHNSNTMNNNNHNNVNRIQQEEMKQIQKNQLKNEEEENGDQLVIMEEVNESSMKKENNEKDEEDGGGMELDHDDLLSSLSP